MFIDLTGQRFGRLLVLKRAKNDPRHRNARFICLCDCGTKKNIRSDTLRRNTKSCGCLHIEQVSQLAKKTLTTHNMSKHPLYWVWASMMQRCENPKNPAYKHYGARGITVCDRWHNIHNFISDMYPGFKRGLEIERKNNDDSYSPDNCVWETRKNQCNNTRHNVFVEFNGQRKTIAQWANELKISHQSMNRRLHCWTISRALTTPAPQ